MEYGKYMVIPKIEKPGIYGIYNVETGNIYIGYSLNLKRRLTEQKHKLINEMGINVPMKKDIHSKEDLNNFVFLILEIHEIKRGFKERNLRGRENQIIREYKNKNKSYNVF